tara:strand:- start:939 stop:1466 length:528 start_codon:yes stop_codon:yes gene_type:complete
MVEHLTKKDWIAVVQWINMRWENAKLGEDKVKELYDDFKFFGEDVVWKSMQLYYENGNTFFNVVDFRRLCKEQYAEHIRDTKQKALTMDSVAELNAGGLIDYLKMNGYESFAHAVYDVMQKRVKAGKPFLNEDDYVDADLPYEQAKDNFLQHFKTELSIDELERRRDKREKEKSN